MNIKMMRAAACVTAALILAGCASFQRNVPGNGYGLIHVGSPRVETRERLINERREMERWLRAQLAELDSKTYKVSGMVELNSLAVTAAQLGIDIDAANRLSAISSKIQQAALYNQLDNDRAQRELINSERDKIIAKAKSGEMTFEQATAAMEKLGLAKPTAPAESSGTQPDTAEVADRSVPNTAMGPDSEKTQAQRSDPRSSSIDATPLEQIMDRLADREWLITAISRMRTDDVHDLKGRTLYRMTFDTSVIPHNDASAWAVVEISIPLEIDAKNSFADLRARAGDQYLRGVRDSSEAIFRSIANRLAGSCYDKEASELNRVRAAASPEISMADARLAAFRRAFGCASYWVGSTTRRALEHHMAGWIPGNNDIILTGPRQNFMVQLDENAIRFSGTQQELKSRNDTLAFWAEWLGEIIDRQLLSDFDSHVLSCFNDLEIEKRTHDFASWSENREQLNRSERGQPPGPFSLKLISRDVPPPNIQDRCGNAYPNQDARFHGMLHKSSAASVYAVTPQESVQRLSEVASNRKVAEMLANLDAITGTAGIKAGIQALRSNDAFYHALRRQPLIVGTTQVGRVSLSNESRRNGEPASKLVFSWILGPSFRLSEDGKVTGFRHNVMQRTVSAELSLPAWMEKLTLEYRTYWLREDGVTTTDYVSPSQVSMQGSMVLELPNQPAEALTAIDEQYLREPRVDDFQQLQVREGEPAAVMITGRNLWRSTDVLIGTQRADKLQMLHDNRTILASFEKIGSPDGAWRVSSAANPNVRLTLVTSEGRVHAGEVMIVPRATIQIPASPSASKPVEGITTRVVAGLDHRLVLTEPLAATDKPELRFTSKQDSKLLVALPSAQFNQDLKTMLFALPRSQVPNLKSGDPIGAHLAIKMSKRASCGEFFSPISPGRRRGPRY